MSTDIAVEARSLRYGDVVIGDPIPGTDRTVGKIIKSVVPRKRDNTVRVTFVGGEQQRFLAEDLVDLKKRDSLPTAYGPRRSRYGG